MNIVDYNGNCYVPVREITPEIGDRIALLTGPENSRAEVIGTVYANGNARMVGEYLLGWMDEDEMVWKQPSPARIIERRILSDGTYIEEGVSVMWFVKGGEYAYALDINGNPSHPKPLPFDAYTWTRWGGLPMPDGTE